MKSKHINKSHNVSYILYHFVCPIKNRRRVLWEEFRVNILKDICREIELNYEIYFLEVWSDIDHVHFLIQSVPMMSPKGIIWTIKSLTWQEMFKRDTTLKNDLLWWKFWTSWYYVNSVWRYTSEETIREYVRNQWENRDYKKLLKSQLKIF
jgi:putative transposase